MKSKGKKKFKQEYDEAGRPTLYEEKLVAKLEEGLKNDFTVGEACLYAGINRATFYRWQEERPEFKDRMEQAKVYLFNIAKKHINKQVRADDTDTVKWLLSRRQRNRYATKVENEMSVVEPLTDDETAEVDEAFENAGI